LLVVRKFIWPVIHPAPAVLTSLIFGNQANLTKPGITEKIGHKTEIARNISNGIVVI